MTTHNTRLSFRAQLTNPRVFGSVLRGDDAETSAPDILIDPDADMSRFDFGAIHYGFNRLLGVPVNVVTPASLSSHAREHILKAARPI